MGILFFLIFGLAIGLIARALMPGPQKMGLVMTTILGVAGSFTGGLLSSLITNHHVMDFNTAGVIGSVIGALVLLFAASALFNRRSFA